jgi:hypothetical protein
MSDPSRPADSTALWLLAESYRDAAECLSQSCLLRHPDPILLLLRKAIATVLAAGRAAPAGAADVVQAADALLAAPPHGLEPAPLLDLVSGLLDATRAACVDRAVAVDAQ